MKRFKKLFLLFPALFYGAVLLAQPANDACANAVALTCGGGAVSGTTVNSVSEPALPGACASLFGVWYTFTGDGNIATISSTAGSGFDHEIDIFSGSCGTLTNIVCRDRAEAAGTETAAIPTVNGTVYYVYVAHYLPSSTATGTFTISWTTCTVPVAGDECATALPLTVNSGLACTSTTSGTTAGATQSRLGCAGGTADDDVWYSFTATSSFHIVEITTSSNDMVIDAFSACGTPISGTCGDEPEIIFLDYLTLGNTYYIRVYTYSSTSTGTFTLCVKTPPPPPSNDICFNPVSLTPQAFASSCSSPVTATTSNANIPASGCISEGQDDVWFTFTANATTEIVRFQSVVATLGTVTAMGLSLYTACGGTQTNCTTSIPLNFGDGQVNLTGLTSGTTYLLRVWTAGTFNFANFDICIINPLPPPANDNCAGAINLTPVAGVFTNPGPQTTVGATRTLPPVTCGGFTSTTANDVWYKFTTDANGGTAVITTTGADFVLQGFSGACNGTNIGCADVSGTVETLTLSGLAANTTYLVRAYIYVNSTGSAFTIDLSGTALPLELASFTGKTESRSNMLRWETLTEKNVQWHIVERSVDGIKWMEVGKTAGQMDAQSPVKYELEDRAPLAKAYYRLRSVDYDGAENFSNSIVLTRKGEHFGITAAYPSPTKNELTVQFASLAEETVTIQVTDFAGRLVLTQEFDADNGINEAVLQLANLQTGVYLLRISNTTATAEPMRIVKE